MLKYFFFFFHFSPSFNHSHLLKLNKQTNFVKYIHRLNMRMPLYWITYKNMIRKNNREKYFLLQNFQVKWAKFNFLLLSKFIFQITFMKFSLDVIIFLIIDEVLYLHIHCCPFDCLTFVFELLYRYGTT